MKKVKRMLDTHIYQVGDEVILKANFNDEKDYIGTVVDVDTTYGHGYYTVDYRDSCGRNMRCGCANKHIRGMLPRIEKVINNRLEISLNDQENLHDTIAHVLGSD